MKVQFRLRRFLRTLLWLDLLVDKSNSMIYQVNFHYVLCSPCGFLDTHLCLLVISFVR